MYMLLSILTKPELTYHRLVAHHRAAHRFCFYATMRVYGEWEDTADRPID